MNNVELLELYKLEKQAMSGPLEPFPTFREWKADYMADYRETHQTKGIEEAVAESDQIIEEAEKELNGLNKTKEKPKTVAPPPPSVKKTTMKSRKPKTISKFTLAKDIYAKMLNEPDFSRKKVIDRFVSSIGLTPAGASTYYQKAKQEFAKVNV